ncbi:hypothetical protein L1049_020592 [Liquidambar formosana]|uniref:Protein kinase domain-containing protein n=1 Tax=Liquidambar formosana TaxID=63359 RepID=A0AAP0S989_LIQFO
MVISVILFLAFLVGPTSVASSDTFSPHDEYLLDCGATAIATLAGGRKFKPDQLMGSFLSSKQDIKISVPFADVPLPIYLLSARIFVEESVYSFPIKRSGWHWVRLHFYPIKNPKFNLQDAEFAVSADNLVLLHSFNVHNNSQWILKEFLVNVTTTKDFSLKFSPMKNRMAFVNAIELVSAPNSIITDVGSSLDPVGNFSGLESFSYQTLFRVNVGGPLISSQSDPLGRTWTTEEAFIRDKLFAKSVSVSPSAVTYSKEEYELIAPRSLYASASQTADYRTNSMFNITWNFDMELAFGYLIRVHFCDIVSHSLHELLFNVYINGKTAISALDLSTETGNLSVAFFKDIVVNAKLVPDNQLTLQVGPMNHQNGSLDAILNGVELFKMKNLVNSLDEEFHVNGGTKSIARSNWNTAAIVGFTLLLGALVFLASIVFKFHCLLLFGGGDNIEEESPLNTVSNEVAPTMTVNNSLGSQKKWLHSSGMEFSRCFSFSELQKATNNFDEKLKIGEGGFGSVYGVEIDDGTKVAVKRGNPMIEQGIHEFKNEIETLCKIWHKNLLRLIGFCAENLEMILVLEFVSGGTLRDHLYGKNMPTMTWKQRLEICIGAANGLDYLHRGTGIIHRDVKTSNILLDETNGSFTAKISDFGFSKNAPIIGKSHVTTVVKGSAGYLDPDYFRTEKLTLMSDVYSFGVVLFEVLCSRPAFDGKLPEEQIKLADWALQCKRKGLLHDIIDPVLVGVIDPESMKIFVETAEECLAEHGVKRPTMTKVVWQLEKALQLQGKTEEESGTSVAAIASPGVGTVPTTSTSTNPPVSQPDEI